MTTQTTRRAVERERQRAYERIRAIADHISCTAELKEGAYIVGTRWIEDLRERLKDWWRAQDRYNTAAIQKEKGGEFKDCLREAKEFRRKWEAAHAGRN